MTGCHRQVVLLMLFLTLVSGCAHFSTPEEVDAPVRVTLLSINDFHGALYETPIVAEQGKAMGGLPWLVGAVNAIREEDPQLLLLDGGDLFQGSWPVNATRGKGAIEAFQLLGVDAAAVGNHEFDYGAGSPGSHPLRGALEEAAAMANFSWLTANVYRHNPDNTENQWHPKGIQPWAILERKGIRFGVIGLSTMETPQTTLSKHVTDLRFRDPVETVRSLLPTLHAAGAQVIIVLGHLSGHCHPPDYFEPPEHCMPSGELGRLLTELPEGSIDVIVVGHAHTLLAQRIGDTFVLEARSRGHVLNRLDMVITSEGLDADASVIHPPWALVHDAVEPGCDEGPFPTEARELGGKMIRPNEDAIALIQDLEKRVGSLCEPVGCATTPLLRKYDSESGLGDLMTDAMLATFPTADAAFTNAGGIRSDMPAGTIRREHVHSVMPFDNRILLIELPGSGIRKLLQIGTSGARGLIQVGGVRVTYDPHRSGGIDLDGNGEISDWEQNRLCGVQLDGDSLDDKRLYRIVTTDFIFTGGDHYGEAFTEATVLQGGPLLRDALLQHISDLGHCVGALSPLPNPKQPRISATRCRKR